MSQPPQAKAARKKAGAAKPSAPRGPKRTPVDAATPPRDPAATREALLMAARAEFGERGFEGTDTNRIARRAGFAPQTFYRHFADKTAVFIETYHRWLADEWKDLEKAHGKGAEVAARILLDHHARHREFRRSLRRLTTSDPSVRAARAESRRRQLGLLEGQDAAQNVTKDVAPNPAKDAAKDLVKDGTKDAAKPREPRQSGARIALLLCIERIADAAADGELDDLGLAPKEQTALLADVIRRLGRPA